MEDGSFAYRLISERQDRLEQVQREQGEELEEIPVLRKEVALLTKAVDRNTTALYSVVGTVVATGVTLLLFQQGIFG